MGPKSLFAGLTLILAAPIVVAACAAATDSTAAGDDALSAAAGDDNTSSRADGGAPVIATLKISGGALDIVEVVAVEDAEAPASDGTPGAPRARLVFSNQTGICNRLDHGYVLASGEKVISVWDGSSFTAGTATLGGAAQAVGGCSFVDQTRLCSVDVGTSWPIPGSGTLDLASVGAKVAGTVDVTVAGLHLSGSFVAKTCPTGRQTFGTAVCTDVSGNSTNDVGAGTDYGSVDGGS
jgi:hypothetical protein